MKCIQCGTNNKLKERLANQGKCVKCQHPFIFEPVSSLNSTRLTDQLFAKAIADISANQTLFFTPRQFFYFLERRLQVI